MIRRCTEADTAALYAIINDAAQAETSVVLANAAWPPMEAR